MKERIAQEIYRTILASTHVLILPHQNPDGDAMGAATALASFLTNHNINWKIWCKTPPPPGLMFLPQADKVITDMHMWDKEKFDLIVVVDSGDLVYNGSSEYIAKLNPRPTLINIDHHATNQQYGDINLVVTTASSTNEILYNVFLLNHEPVTGQMATSLMTGLITDTGTFTNAATSKRALSVGGELIKRGADFRLIKNEVITDKSVAGLRLWGLVMNRLTLHEPTGIVHTYVLLEDLTKCNATEQDADGIANFLNFLEEGKASMVLKERPDGTFKGSFRTTRDDVNVSAWAQLFGGGGHVKAAGFAVPGPIDKAIEHILQKIEEKIKNQDGPN